MQFHLFAHPVWIFRCQLLQLNENSQLYKKQWMNKYLQYILVFWENLKLQSFISPVTSLLVNYNTFLLIKVRFLVNDFIFCKKAAWKYCVMSQNEYELKQISYFGFTEMCKRAVFIKMVAWYLAYFACIWITRGLKMQMWKTWKILSSIRLRRPVTRDTKVLLGIFILYNILKTLSI